MTDTDKVGGNVGNWDMIYMFIYGENRDNI